MKKLIELLNEYEAKLEETPLARRKWREERGILYRRFMNVEDAERMVISKSFGFIKWLVENEKIDKSKVFSFIDTADKPYEDILCLLALSDEPINDLISILK